MKRAKNLIFIVLTVLILVACNKDNTTPEQQQPTVPQIIIDTDICSSTDDLFAMQLLYQYASQGKCNLLGVIVDRMGDTNAAVADLKGDDLIGLSPRGHIVFNDENKISFITDPDGNYRYQISGDEAWADRMLNLIRASSSPLHSL